MSDTNTATATVENVLMAIDYDQPKQALAALASGKCSMEQYAEWQSGREDLLRAQALRAAKSAGRLTTKVSEKGGVSIYGLGRWPVTLYREQWARLFASREAIELFIQANLSVLKPKKAKAAEAKKMGRAQ